MSPGIWSMEGVGKRLAIGCVIGDVPGHTA
jgi:hypothetical protein